MKKLLFLVLVFMLSSCVPPLLGSPNWVRIALAPNALERNAACDRAIAQSSTSVNAFKLDNLVAGVVDFGPEENKVSLFSSIGGTYTLCRVLGFTGRKPAEIPNVGTFIVIKQEQLQASALKTIIELNDVDGKVFHAINPSSTEAKSGELNVSFRRITAADTSAMEKAASLSVVIERGKGEERYRLTREMFGNVLLLIPRGNHAR
jgi:hypothetical protein